MDKSKNHGNIEKVMDNSKSHGNFEKVMGLANKSWNMRKNKHGKCEKVMENPKNESWVLPTQYAPLDQFPMVSGRLGPPGTDHPRSRQDSAQVVHPAGNAPPPHEIEVWPLAPTKHRVLKAPNTALG